MIWDDITPVGGGEVRGKERKENKVWVSYVSLSGTAGAVRYWGEVGGKGNKGGRLKFAPEGTPLVRTRHYKK
jgi:hypothetical protein